MFTWSTRGLDESESACGAGPIVQLFRPLCKKKRRQLMKMDHTNVIYCTHIQFVNENDNKYTITAVPIVCIAAFFWWFRFVTSIDNRPFNLWRLTPSPAPPRKICHWTFLFYDCYIQELTTFISPAANYAATNATGDKSALHFQRPLRGCPYIT